MTGFWVALRFLTIFPTPRKEKDDEKVAYLSLVYFPLVGLLLGAVLLGTYYALALVLPSPVVFALVVIALAVITGGHHLDGLMDSLDGVFGGKSKEERLAIMRDSKVGAFGVAGAILLLLLKYVSLTLAPLLPALLLMPTLGRWAMLNAIFFFPYARPDGMGLPFKQGANWQRLTIATILPVVAAMAILRWKGLILLVVLWLTVFCIGRFIQHRLGGLTGDNYGAINEIAETATIILIVLLGRF